MSEPAGQAASDHASAPRARRFRDHPVPQTKYAEAALERHKREGLELAVRMRWITMPLLGVFVVIINPHWDVVFYHAILALLVLNGWLLHRVGRVGQSRLEMALILADLTLMTIGMVVPNPLSDETQPLAMQYWYDNFLYFFIILAAGTLAFSWRTVIAMGSGPARSGGWRWRWPGRSPPPIPG